MNQRTPLLVSLLSTSLFAGAVMAQAQSQQPQNQTMPSTSPTQSQPAPTTPPAAPTQGTTNSTGNSNSNSNGAASSATGGNDSATYNTGQGQVTINSTVPNGPSTASPPSFQQLSNGKKYITKDDANAYPPLANDFLYVSHNGSRISKAQYERWVKNLN